MPITNKYGQTRYPKDAQNFPWESDIPDDDFWGPLPFTIGRNFLACVTPAELTTLQPSLDANSGLDLPGKARLLLTHVDAKLAAHGPPAEREGSKSAWRQLILARFTMLDQLGEMEEGEKTARLLMETPKEDGEREMSAVNMMGWLLVKKGDYAGGLGYLRESLEWLTGLLGKDSPQALGATRAIIQAVWKEGDVERARGLVEETRGVIEGMKGGKFEKYLVEEREELERVVKELEGV